MPFRDLYARISLLPFSIPTPFPNSWPMRAESALLVPDFGFHQHVHLNQLKGFQVCANRTPMPFRNSPSVTRLPETPISGICATSSLVPVTALKVDMGAAFTRENRWRIPIRTRRTNTPELSMDLVGLGERLDIRVRSIIWDFDFQDWTNFQLSMMFYTHTTNAMWEER